MNLHNLFIIDVDHVDFGFVKNFPSMTNRVWIPVVWGVPKIFFYFIAIITLWVFFLP